MCKKSEHPIIYIVVQYILYKYVLGTLSLHALKMIMKYGMEINLIYSNSSNTAYMLVFRKGMQSVCQLLKISIPQNGKNYVSVFKTSSAILPLT